MKKFAQKGFPVFLLVGVLNLISVSQALAVTLNWGFKVPAPWIQTQGGDVHAVGAFSPDPLPIPTPTPVIGGFFSLDQPAGNPGIVSCTSGCTNFGGGQVSTRGWKVSGASLGIQPYDFTRYNTRLNPNNTCAIVVGNTLTAAQIVAAGNISPTIHCFRPESGNTITINSDPNIGSGLSRVVFIGKINPGTPQEAPGNLVINNPVTVNQGGFLAFIVSGDISFSQSVGSTPPDTTVDVAGVYIASGKLTVSTTGDPATEKEFIGRGTFVGYNGVEVKRNLGNLNASYPAAFFKYDTELARRIDNKLTRSQILWEQVPP